MEPTIEINNMFWIIKYKHFFESDKFTSVNVIILIVSF